MLDPMAHTNLISLSNQLDTLRASRPASSNRLFPDPYAEFEI